MSIQANTAGTEGEERRQTSRSPHMETYTAAVGQIVAAYVQRQEVAIRDLPEVVRRVYHAVLQMEGGSNVVRLPAGKPAVAIDESVTQDYLICLESGKPMKMLKRHLRTSYGMTPEQYRARWGLPVDYPMVAPKYAEKRSELARTNGLGQARKSGTNYKPRGKNRKPSLGGYSHF